METVLRRDEAAPYSVTQIKWGAIFAGAVVAVGLWILFHVLGLAAGLTSIDPSDHGSWRAAGIGTGVWSVIASLLALAAGGLVAGRIAGPIDRVGSALHGGVLWAFTTVSTLALVMLTAGMLIQGAAQAGGAAVGAAGGLGSLAANADPLKALGLDAKELIAPLNQKLSEQGKPAVTPDQIQASVQTAAKSAVQQGHLDRGILIGALEQNTALTRADVEDLATQVEQRMNKLGEGVDRAQTSALQAAESAGKGLWWVFGAMLLALMAAVGGALVGSYSWKPRAAEATQDIELRRKAPLDSPAHAHS